MIDGLASSQLRSVNLDRDQLDVLIEDLEISELPVVLDALPRVDEVGARARAFERGRASLERDGLMTGGLVEPTLRRWMRTLERPDWHVDARQYNGDSMLRICFAADASTSVMAVRHDLHTSIYEVSGLPGRQLLRVLGSADPTEARSVSLPSDDLAEALDGSRDVSATIKRLRYVGVEQAEASALARAMATCHTHAEIVAIRRGDGTRTQIGGPIALFETSYGRIAATSSVAGDGQRWSTFGPGSDARIKHAIDNLAQAAS